MKTERDLSLRIVLFAFRHQRLLDWALAFAAGMAAGSALAWRWM